EAVLPRAGAGAGEAGGERRHGGRGSAVAVDVSAVVAAMSPLATLPGHDDQRARVLVVAAEEVVFQPGLNVDVDLAGAVGSGDAVSGVHGPVRPGRGRDAELVRSVAVFPAGRLEAAALAHHHP